MSTNQSTGVREPHQALPNESWLPVVGYEGRYEVSNQGRVRSLDRERLRNIGSGVETNKLKGRILRACRRRSGHYACSLGDGKRQSVRVVHQLVLEAFVGPRPEGYEACHNNGDPSDNRVENLRWDTKSANALDSVRHGTHWQARKTHCAKGHEYTPENTFTADSGHRHCLTCRPSTGAGSHGSKTHCKRGHEFTPDNTLQSTRGRKCRACARIHRLTFKNRKVGQP